MTRAVVIYTPVHNDIPYTCISHVSICSYFPYLVGIAMAAGAMGPATASPLYLYTLLFCRNLLAQSARPKMPTQSRDFKSSALVLALVLVPIAILICALAVALACSEFWSYRPATRYTRCLSRRRPQANQSRVRTQTAFPEPRGSDCTGESGFTITPLEYEEPVLPREHV